MSGSAMAAEKPNRRRVRNASLAALALAAASAMVWHVWPSTQAPPPLLLAPMIGGLDQCLFAPQAVNVSPKHPQLDACLGEQGSAAVLVTDTLDRIGSGVTGTNSDWPLGYTLQVPLLKLFRQQGGDWVVDTDAVSRLARTVQQVARPVVLYLFSNHFSARTPLEAELARDPANLAQSANGPLPVDSYYGDPLYPWSVARTDNAITRYREQAIKALASTVCGLPAETRQWVQGVTLLGEVHQLYPRFETGMGFEAGYEVSDYSAVSVAGFRAYLAEELGTVERLNALVGGSYERLEDVRPPSKNARAEHLDSALEHMDGFAMGKLPIGGWVFAPDISSPRVHVYLNGTRIATVEADRSRQDVLASNPKFGRAEVGWRHDLDYRELPPGVHQIDALLEVPGETPMHLGQRLIAFVQPHQKSLERMFPATLPPSQPLAKGVLGHMDLPADQSVYIYNPLARLWQDFRERQVANYIAHFARLVSGTCLGEVPLYSHQILPFVNPGWDVSKFAIERSLAPDAPFAMGVSLYGDAAHGPPFLSWVHKSGHRHYGVTEFHPLKALDAQGLKSVLTAHREQGARFLSFFLEARAGGRTLQDRPNFLSLDPENHQFGSDRLYESLREVVKP